MSWLLAAPLVLPFLAAVAAFLLRFGPAGRWVSLGGALAHLVSAVLLLTVVLEEGGIPFTLDSLRPSIPLRAYREHEGRFKVLANEHPDEAERLLNIAQAVVHQRWAIYEQMATSNAADFHPDARRDAALAAPPTVELPPGVFPA